jgi:hypothetical protein
MVESARTMTTEVAEHKNKVKAGYEAYEQR